MESTVLELVRSVVAQLSEELGYENLRVNSADTILFGGSDGIDSLSLVRIIAELEQVADEKFGKHVVLADERAMSRRNSPYQTIGSLAELLGERLAEQS